MENIYSLQKASLTEYRMADRTLGLTRPLIIHADNLGWQGTW